MTAYVIANFGGPRSLPEVEPFLRSLFTDREVFRTKIPSPFFQWLFGRIAKKRTLSVCKDYAEIGGGSPIYEDTEFVAQRLRERLDGEVLTFHRYLPVTHSTFLQKIETLDVQRIRVFPMFPQFTYATTGSIAKFFSQKLSHSTLLKLRWIKSYPTHPSFISLTQKMIGEAELNMRETILFFSAHGLPQRFVDEGDVYKDECIASVNEVKKAFPEALSHLGYQSKVGRAVWLEPSTISLCQNIDTWGKGRKNVLFVPISFTSDHIETLFEVEREYMPVVCEKGFVVRRLPAFNRREEWIETIIKILYNETTLSNAMLVRNR
ncbi:MAG: ferrochelatase [Chlamydiales bacterium]